jgi:protein-tyrosine phosphatase
MCKGVNHYCIDTVFHIGFEIEENMKLEGVMYHFIDLQDDSASADRMIQYARKVIPQIDECLLRGESVLVCCLMGRSRSASLIIYWMHTKYPEMSYEDVVNKIKTVRTISPNQTFADKLRVLFAL